MDAICHSMNRLPICQLLAATVYMISLLCMLPIVYTFVKFLSTKLFHVHIDCKLTKWMYPYQTIAKPYTGRQNTWCANWETFTNMYVWTTYEHNNTQFEGLQYEPEHRPIPALICIQHTSTLLRFAALSVVWFESMKPTNLYQQQVLLTVAYDRSSYLLQISTQVFWLLSIYRSQTAHCYDTVDCNNETYVRDQSLQVIPSQYCALERIQWIV